MNKTKNLFCLIFLLFVGNFFLNAQSKNYEIRKLSSQINRFVGEIEFDGSSFVLSKALSSSNTIKLLVKNYSGIHYYKFHPNSTEFNSITLTRVNNNSDYKLSFDGKIYKILNLNDNLEKEENQIFHIDFKLKTKSSYEVNQLHNSIKKLTNKYINDLKEKRDQEKEKRDQEIMRKVKQQMQLNAAVSSDLDKDKKEKKKKKNN